MTSLKTTCTKEADCPWGVRPVVGMWAEVHGVQFFGTDCLVYRNCDRVKQWEPKEWKANRVAFLISRAVEEEDGND
jgi:hypothetical protein